MLCPDVSTSKYERRKRQAFGNSGIGTRREDRGYRRAVRSATLGTAQRAAALRRHRPGGNRRNGAAGAHRWNAVCLGPGGSRLASRGVAPGFTYGGGNGGSDRDAFGDAIDHGHRQRHRVGHAIANGDRVGHAGSRYRLGDSDGSYSGYGGALGDAHRSPAHGYHNPDDGPVGAAVSQLSPGHDPDLRGGRRDDNPFRP